MTGLVLMKELQAAPGKVLTTTDGWTADNKKCSFLGMTANWINVNDGMWTMWAKVIGFQLISGEHSGLLGPIQCLEIIPDLKNNFNFERSQSQNDFWWFWGLCDTKQPPISGNNPAPSMSASKV